MKRNAWYRGTIIVLLAVAAALILSHRKPATMAPLAESLPEAPAASRAGLPRLVDLGAGKCIPCKMMAPILEELKREQAGKIEVAFIDVWQNPDAGRRYGISVIPTQIFIDADGKEFFRHEGFFPKEEILTVFNKHGFTVAENKSGR